MRVGGARILRAVVRAGGAVEHGRVVAWPPGARRSGLRAVWPRGAGWWSAVFDPAMRPAAGSWERGSAPAIGALELAKRTPKRPQA